MSISRPIPRRRPSAWRSRATAWARSPAPWRRPSRRGRAAAAGRGEAARVRGGGGGRVRQESPALVPDRQLEAVAAHRAVVARRRPAEAVPVGPEAAVVAVLGRPAADL